MRRVGWTRRTATKQKATDTDMAFTPTGHHDTFGFKGGVYLTPSRAASNGHSSGAKSGGEVFDGVQISKIYDNAVLDVVGRVGGMTPAADGNGKSASLS